MKRDDFLAVGVIKGARSMVIPKRSGSGTSCKAMDCGCESCRKPIYVGIDVGERYTVGLTTINTATDSFQTLAINSQALNRPLREHRHFLENQKDDSVYENESLLGGKLDLADFVNVHSNLSKFYNSDKLAQRRHHTKAAHRSEWDKAVHQILTTVDGACYSRARNQPVFFGIGSSQIKGQAGPFVRHLVKKLRSLDYANIFYVEEPYTSQKCCRCESQTDMVKDTCYRVKHCNSCSLYHHRDILAGHNIAKILQSYVEEGVRPAYLPLSNQL